MAAASHELIFRREDSDTGFIAGGLDHNVAIHFGTNFGILKEEHVVEWSLLFVAAPCNKK